MQIFNFSLNERFPALGGENDATYVECYVNDSRETFSADPNPYPCLVICPGGGYGHVSPREAAPIGMHFLSEGYHVFIVRYSTRPYCFPQQLREVAAAMEIIYEHAEEWQCDTNDITIMGFSAGGHLAAQYSNRYDCPEVREMFPNSKAVGRTILCYPVITDDSSSSHAASITNFLGHEPTARNENGCSCECLVTENTPPTFIWHTAADELVSVENSLLYANALSAHKVPFELHIYPYGGHGLATADAITNSGEKIDAKTGHCHEWLEACKKWLKLR